MSRELEIVNQEVIDNRKQVNINRGTGLLNIVERPSELAATERAQRDSINNHIDQLSAENDVA